MNDAEALVLDGYLNEVSWAMGGTLAEQQAARDELRGHIAEAVGELELQGMSSSDAFLRALVDLGDPSTVGNELHASRGSAALARPLGQRAGALILTRHRERHLPHAGIASAIAAAAAMSGAIALLYAWPR